MCEISLMPLAVFSLCSRKPFAPLRSLVVLIVQASLNEASGTGSSISSIFAAMVSRQVVCVGCALMMCHSL